METTKASPSPAEPVAPWCFHTVKQGARDSHDWPVPAGRYALYPDHMKLYLAPAAALVEQDAARLELVREQFEHQQDAGKAAGELIVWRQRAEVAERDFIQVHKNCIAARKCVAWLLEALNEKHLEGKNIWVRASAQGILSRFDEAFPGLRGDAALARPEDKEKLP